MLGCNDALMRKPAVSSKADGPHSSPKEQTTIGCWNVKTMAEATRTAQVAKEMAEYGIEVLGISETRWKGMGSRG